MCSTRFLVLGSHNLVRKAFGCSIGLGTSDQSQVCIGFTACHVAFHCEMLCRTGDFQLASGYSSGLLLKEQLSNSKPLAPRERLKDS